MRKLTQIIAIIITLISISIPSFAGGGWPQKKGEGYIKVSEWWIVSAQHYTDQGLIDPNVTTGIFNTNAYLEYGLTNRITSTVYFPFYSRSYNNNLVSNTTKEILIAGDAINSVGDAELGLTYGLSKGKINTTISLIVGLPLGIDDGGALKNLQTGDGEFNQIFKFDAGSSYKLFGKDAYSTVNVGFNNRTKGFSDEFRWGIESGISLFNNKLLPIVRIFGVSSLKNGELATNDNSTSIFANNAEHITISPELNYYINKKWGLSANIAAALYGKIIFASPSYSIGVFAKF